MIKQCLPMLALVLSLAACEAIAPAGGQPTVAEVQSIGVHDCAFLPTKETADKIIAARSAQLDTSAAIAGAICTAVATERRGTVAGVPIEGLKVR
jgi:hypothetical protein